jgi:hypothetical protein
MRTLLIILTFLTAKATVAQTTVDLLWDKANDLYCKKQFDSSIFYYQQITREQYPKNWQAFINDKIADCYLGLSDTTNAEKYYLQCLSIDKRLDSVGFSQTRTCKSLSSIYYHRKQFRQALTYLDYTKTKYKPLRMLCQGTHGAYEQRLEFAYKKSLCYYGLDKKDSALIQLAPLIFRPTWDVYLDSLEFEEMSQYFVKTVFEVYGCAKARTDLQKAINGLIYIPNYDTSYNMISLSVDCFISFAKTRVYLDGGGGYQVDKKGDIPSFFSKDTLLKEFTDSPAYKYIMGDIDYPVTGDNRFNQSSP